MWADKKIAPPLDGIFTLGKVSYVAIIREHIFFACLYKVTSLMEVNVLLQEGQLFNKDF